MIFYTFKMNHFKIVMKKLTLLLAVWVLAVSAAVAQDFRVKGLCIGAPAPDDLDDFVSFIDNELASAGVNTLVLMVNYGYDFKSQPELVAQNPLKERDVKKLVSVCRKHQIRLIPQINLLGHQSWHGSAGKLLEVYPEFDETPRVELPKEYKWPNPDGLYCKSYCPLHPDVHRVVFALVDEIVAVFEADAFHAGMDEVFYLGHNQCPRCFGHDPAELFAGEVTLIRDHLQANGKELWIWGDRLIDGKISGIGEWEGSFNNTHRAVDWIPKDVVICDWHYEQAHPTSAIFAAKGLQTVTCPWNKSQVAVEQVAMLKGFLKNSSKAMQPRFAGMMQTVWGSARRFMDSYRGKVEAGKEDQSAVCFRELVKIW